MGVEDYGNCPPGLDLYRRRRPPSLPGALGERSGIGTPQGGALGELGGGPPVGRHVNTCRYADQRTAGHNTTACRSLLGQLRRDDVAVGSRRTGLQQIRAAAVRRSLAGFGFGLAHRHLNNAAQASADGSSKPDICRTHHQYGGRHGDGPVALRLAFGSRDAGCAGTGAATRFGRVVMLMCQSAAML